VSGARAAAASQPVLLAGALAGLAVLAWAALLAWEHSSLAHAMHVSALGAPSLECARPAPLEQAALYVGGWLLMTVAMMLPTAIPLANVFLRLTGRRTDRVRLFALLVAGYLLAWLAFGIVAHLAHALAAHWGQGSGWLWTHPWVVPAATLALAGAFQFSRLKQACLDECRSPLPFVVARWSGTAPRRDALRLGIAHGVYCVGCCWALMLLMFTVGVGSVAWMLLLGAVMAVEKNAPWGRRIGAPLGVALLAAAAWVAYAGQAGLA
jgi:predicted metal-binding membrane protein